VPASSWEADHRGRPPKPALPPQPVFERFITLCLLATSLQRVTLLIVVIFYRPRLGPYQLYCPGRYWRAEQGRRPKELAFAGITTIAAAVAPAETGTPSLPTAAAECAPYCASTRNAGWATTIPSNGAVSPCRSRRAPLSPHFVRAMVRLHEYPNGRLAIFHGPHRLADYELAGNLCDGTKLAA
jgi:hypothetical protein